jgi:two-component system, chemotaxis family, chemotaxis protein CheY
MARVLIIDDDRQIRALMRQVLGRAGHEVAEAGDGIEGVAAFKAEPADLAVIDIYMPGRNGWATIRALEEEAPGLPLLIVSGGGALERVGPGSVGTLERLRGRTPFRVLRKPFKPDVLLATVETLLHDGVVAESSR